jgi:hypothetical protein
MACYMLIERTSFQIERKLREGERERERESGRERERMNCGITWNIY